MLLAVILASTALAASVQAQAWITTPQQCSGAPPTIPIDVRKYPPNGAPATIVAGDTEAQNAFNAIMSGPLASIINSTPIKKLNSNGAIVTAGYSSADPDCWWTSTLCQQPKTAGLPADIFQLAPAKTWGLTIDDGPDCVGEPMYAFLESKNQLATAFFVGGNVLSYPDQARRIFQSGHEIAGHSWSHNAMTTLSHQSLFAEVFYTRRIIKETTGVSISTFRCPYGDVDNRVRAFLKALDIEYISWSRDTNDWTAEDAAAQNKDSPTAQSQADYNEIIAAVSSSHGDIVLHHETSAFTGQLLADNYAKILSSFAAMVPVTVGRNIASPYTDSSCTFPSFAQYQAGQRGNCGAASLPSGSVSSVPATPTPSGTPTGACTTTYTIKAGDFCYAIATTASPALTVDQLMCAHLYFNDREPIVCSALNPGLNCDAIQPGQTLCLARAAAPASSVQSSVQPPPSSSSASSVQPPSSASSVQPPLSSSASSVQPPPSSAASSASSVASQEPSSGPQSSIEQPSSSSPASSEPSSSAPSSSEPVPSAPAPASSDAPSASVDLPSSSSSAPSGEATAGPAPSGMTYACPSASAVGFGAVVQTIVGNALLCVYSGSPLRRHRRQVIGGTCTYDAISGAITGVEGSASCPQVATLVAITLSSAPSSDASSSAPPSSNAGQSTSSLPTPSESSPGAGPTTLPSGSIPSLPPADNGIDPRGPRCTAGPGEIARKWWRRKHRRDQNRDDDDDEDDTSIPGNPVIIPVPRPDGGYDCEGEDGPALEEAIKESRPESSEQPWPEVSIVVPGEGTGVVDLPGVGAPIVGANGTNVDGPARLPGGSSIVAPFSTPALPPNSAAGRLMVSSLVGAALFGVVLVV